ncbi:MAG: hypothetical protein HYV07_07255 [Deltaproteobacteria bacterium]|nr:hypothetical protein [Deltaproteobacteria bacterium]
MGESFLGTPVFEVGGSVQQDAAAAARLPPTELRLSLFWIGFDSRNQQRPVVEQRTLLDGAFATFRMTVFEDPQADALKFGWLTEGGPMIGLALIVLYADNNENEALNSYTSAPEDGPDIVLGASVSHLVAYSSGAVPFGSLASELLGPIGPGYHVFRNLGGVCPFARSSECVGSGVLELDANPTIVLSLEASSSAVQVPNPRVPGQSSGTSPSPNLYSQGGS